jgi:hypothetical protein
MQVTYDTHKTKIGWQVNKENVLCPYKYVGKTEGNNERHILSSNMKLSGY